MDKLFVFLPPTPSRLYLCEPHLLPHIIDFPLHQYHINVGIVDAKRSKNNKKVFLDRKWGQSSRLDGWIFYFVRKRIHSAPRAAAGKTAGKFIKIIGAETEVNNQLINGLKCSQLYFKILIWWKLEVSWNRIQKYENWTRNKHGGIDFRAEWSECPKCLDFGSTCIYTIVALHT